MTKVQVITDLLVDHHQEGDILDMAVAMVMAVAVAMAMVGLHHLRMDHMVDLLRHHRHILMDRLLMDLQHPLVDRHHHLMDPTDHMVDLHHIRDHTGVQAVAVAAAAVAMDPIIVHLNINTKNP